MSRIEWAWPTFFRGSRFEWWAYKITGFPSHNMVLEAMMSKQFLSVFVAIFSLLTNTVYAESTNSSDEKLYAVDINSSDLPWSESHQNLATVSGTDISEVPFWDGETNDHSGPLLNRFGGNPGPGKHATVSYVTDIKHSGNGAFRIDTNQEIPANDFDFITINLTGFGPSSEYIDTRDITNFTKIKFWIRNGAGLPTLTLEIKDFRESNSHRIRCSIGIPSQLGWSSITVSLIPLDVKRCVVIGNPDLTHTKQFVLVMEAKSGSPVNGSLYLDDMVLIERGGVLNSKTAPINSLVDRLAKRQFLGLWGLRDRDTGLVSGTSLYADYTALNTTAALIKLLPIAVKQSWITHTKADNYVNQVVDTLNTVMDKAQSNGGGYVPPRYIDRVTLEYKEPPAEESIIDAAFMFLALYQYKSSPYPISLGEERSFLGEKIAGVLERFNFAAFKTVAGWSMAYVYGYGFKSDIYDGYSGEIWLISLAAHLQKNPAYHVDIGDLYHSGIRRVRDSCYDGLPSPVVHESKDFRPPFSQWLFSLFVDVKNRKVDTYPKQDLATNPYRNAVLYQSEVHAFLAQGGRPLFLQPDAGDDGTGNAYNQYSCYKHFGRPDLFMPWSVGFSFLADPKVAGSALRNHLSYRLHGPLGLTEAVHWTTGKDQPSVITALHDFWNTSLSTMALMQYRFGGNQLLADLPEVRAALDKVFKK